ncbi:MAG: MBL fold metallo-hydrolase [Verrucomicrobia bacterium]|nr:MBL fold metallo-hydrolase [Verrucomicrobiota bacterium]
MSVQLTVLGSGSSGNCAYLETAECRLLIDAGLSGRQIRQRLLGLGRAPETLTGILITHEHTDHTQALGVLAAKLGIPVYCNRLTGEAIAAQFPGRLNFRLFSTGSEFEVGDVRVETFSVPHDAHDPVGFVIRTVAGAVGFLTDLGHATKLVIERARAANILVLEANHDLHLLQADTRRPWSTKQRILSRHGHLSNHAAAEAAGQIASGRLRQLILAHLSADCNRPELARDAACQALHRAGASHVCVTTAAQHVLGPTVALTRPHAPPNESTPSRETPPAGQTPSQPAPAALC